MGMLGEQSLQVALQSAGSFVDGDWVPGAESGRTIRGVLQPLQDRELQQLPEAWRSRARWKLYSKSRLQTIDTMNQTDADIVFWYDPAQDHTHRLLVAGFRDYLNTPNRMVLRHFKYALIEPEIGADT